MKAVVRKPEVKGTTYLTKLRIDKKFRNKTKNFPRQQPQKF